VIATLITAHPHRDVLIKSMDQDYYQLLRDAGPARGAVRVLNTAMRPGRRLIGPAKVTARYGITPAQYPDFRALCGDTSDNIPGVAGIGTRTAATLLDGGLSLDDLPASGRLSGTKGARITAAWPQVLTWRSMIRMRTRIPLPAEPVGIPTIPLPAPAQVIQQLGLWDAAASGQATAASGT
jgi:DNA polymerase-1